MEITSDRQNRVKRAEDSLRDLWDHIKCTNIWIIEVPEEEKKKRYEKFFEEITVENFPNKEKQIVDQLQKAQSPIQDKPKEKHAKTHTNPTKKTKHKERILKSVREKQQVTYKGNPIRLTADLSAETCRPEGNGRVYLKYWKGKIYNQNYCTQQVSHSKLMQK